MNTLSILLQAAPQGGNFNFIIMMVLVFVIMWFFMIRPQQKRQKEMQNFQNSVTIGTAVITQGGIHGTVKGVDEVTSTVRVEVASGVCITLDRSAIFPLGQK